MTKELLRKQNVDLRTRISNLHIKMEIAYEELNRENKALTKKLNDKDEQIKMFQHYIATREKQIAKLTKTLSLKNNEIVNLKSELDQLKDQRDKFKAILSKDSSNSSKPSSTNGFRKAKASSLRESSGKKPGGQKGHVGSTIKTFSNPTKIIDIKPEPICSCGGNVKCDDEYTAKQEVDIRIVIEVTEERAHKGKCNNCGKIHHAKFSEEFINPVQYGSNLKTLISILNGYGNVTINKTVDILNSISGGVLNLSEGTVVNIQRTLAEKLETPLNIIKQRLIQCNVLGTDETGCHVNGKLNWIQIFSNDYFTLFGFNKKRGQLNDDMDILDLFSGILVHDHFKAYYGYTLMTHAECNAHILRYLKAVIEIMKHPWATKFTELLRSANKLKKQYIHMGKSSIETDEFERISKQYDEILELGKQEYIAATENKKNISYYNDERLLLKRLGEYKKEHLKFLEKFEVPFDNNGSERGARFFKSKSKVSGGFRSDEGVKNYAKIASLISTLKKQGTNVYVSINNIFNGILPTFDSEQSISSG